MSLSIVVGSSYDPTIDDFNSGVVFASRGRSVVVPLGTIRRSDCDQLSRIYERVVWELTISPETYHLVYLIGHAIGPRGDTKAAGGNNVLDKTELCRIYHTLQLCASDDVKAGEY